MLKLNALASLIALLLIGSYTFAGTVTLTASCPLNVVNSTNTHISFNLSNSGDDVAGGIVVSPIIKGALTYNSTVSLGELLPGQSTAPAISVTNLTQPGEYVDYFVTRYSQGEQTFVTVFPCLAAMQSKSQSVVQVANITTLKNQVLVTMLNSADYSVNATATLEVPPSFNINRPSANAEIAPQSTALVSFDVSAPQYNATFPISFSASYVLNGTSYSVLQVTDFSTASQPQSGSPIKLNPPEIVFVVLIVGVACLITISIAKKKRRSVKGQKVV
ncbi:MAG TPA: hypothetical protein VND15_04090 [Candidatus Acidoferrales bacterium]|nr:hypothetical protein [Candidatus Acidoferrales bacterium]